MRRPFANKHITPFHLEQFNAPQDILSRATSVNIRAARCGWVGPVFRELRTFLWLLWGHELRVVCSTKCVMPEVFTKSCLFIYITHILVCTMSHVLGGSGIACRLQYSIGCSTHAVGLQYSVKYPCWVWSTDVQCTVPMLWVGRAWEPNVASSYHPHLHSYQHYLDYPNPSPSSILIHHHKALDVLQTWVCSWEVVCKWCCMSLCVLLW